MTDAVNVHMDEELMAAYAAYCDYMGDDSTDRFNDAYMGKYDCEEEFAWWIVHEQFDIERAMGNLAFYFDYASFARDLFVSDYTYVDGYVFANI